MREKGKMGVKGVTSHLGHMGVLVDKMEAFVRESWNVTGAGTAPVRPWGPETQPYWESRQISVVRARSTWDGEVRR